MNKNNIVLLVIVVIAVAGIGLLSYPKLKNRIGTSELEPFASCLKDKGALPLETLAEKTGCALPAIQ